MFDWKSEVPAWAVLRFAQMKTAFTANGQLEKSIRMTGWKATPKGGKLTYEVGRMVSQVQLYK